MGNTVSAAERIAADIVHPAAAAAHPHATAAGYSKDAVPPPECPMHQKDADAASPPPAAAKEESCPLGHGKDDINPLNMVRI